MVRVIMGKKGSGKTKQMIDLINSAVGTERGYVVCIERSRAMTFSIDSSIRLVEADDYDINSFEFLKGVISGLYAGNYDITHMFIDSLHRIVDVEPSADVDNFLDWLDAFSEKNGIKFTVTISDDPSTASPAVAKYF